MTIFLDTSFLIAIYDESDEKHSDAKNLFDLMKSGEFGRTITSTYVIDELITYVLKMNNSFDLAKRLTSVWITQQKGFATVVDVSWGDFLDTAELFINQDPQNRLLSFTDCSIITTAKKMKIQTILTFDSGFDRYMTVIR